MKYFNLITGDLFELPEDMNQALEKYCLRLNDYPKPNCKKCYGRFYISYNKTKKIYNICSQCAKKYCIIDTENFNIEIPRQTSEFTFNN